MSQPRRFRCFLLTIFAIICCQGAFAAAAPHAFVQDGVTMVPLRYIVEWYGGSIRFSASSAPPSVIVLVNGRTAVLTKRLPSATLNGKQVALDTPPSEITGTMYISTKTCEDVLGILQHTDDFGVTIYHGKSILLLQKDTSQVRNASTAITPLYLPGTAAAPTKLADETSPTFAKAIEGGAMLYHFNYKEVVPDPLKSTEDGNLAGLYLQYASLVDDKYPSRIKAEYTDGQTHYDGTLMDGTPTQSTTNDTFFRLEGDMALTSLASNNVLDGFSIYGGLGYRFWKRELTGSGGYTEDYWWIYAPIGVRKTFVASPGWSGTVDVSVRPMLLGRININLSEANPAYDDASATLGNKIGFRIEVPFHHPLSTNTDLVLTPWYEYSAIGQSSTFDVTTNEGIVGVGYEPDSHTNQFGVYAGVRVLF